MRNRQRFAAISFAIGEPLLSNEIVSNCFLPGSVGKARSPLKFVARSIFAFLLVLILGGNSTFAEEVDFEAISQRLEGTGIELWQVEDRTHVGVGSPLGWPFDLDAADLLILKEVGQIETLTIRYQRGFRADDYAFLGQLKSVRRLSIVGFAGDCRKLVAHVGQCRELESLWIYAPKLAPGDVAGLNNAKRLSELMFACRRIGPEHITEIRNLKVPLASLRLADLSGDSLTDAYLSPLLELDDLRILEVNARELTAEERDRMSRQLSQCDIRFSSDDWRDEF